MGTYPAGNIIQVTPTLSTDAYADNDVLFDATEIPNAVSSRGGVSRLIAITIHSQNTDLIDYDLILMKKQTNLGTINEAVGSGSLWTDDLAQSAKVTGLVVIDGTDNNASLAATRLYHFSGPHGTSHASGLPMLLQAEPGETSIYFSAVLRDGTPTYAADDIDFIFHIEYLG